MIKTIFVLILYLFILQSLCQDNNIIDQTVNCNDTFTLFVKQNYTVNISSTDYFNCYTYNCQEDPFYDVKWCSIKPSNQDLCTVSITRSKKTNSCISNEYFKIKINLKEDNDLLYILLIVELIFIWMIITFFITKNIISKNSDKIEKDIESTIPDKNSIN